MADKTVRILSEEELKLIQGMIDRERRGLLNPQSRPPSDGYLSEFNDHQGPDCYIALPTEGDGIPGLTRSPTGTGTGGAQEGDTPGSAECDIYQLVDGVLLEVTTLGDLVYNLNEEAVEQGWVVVHRTKFGDWVVSVNAVAVRMVITQLNPGTGTGTSTGSDATSTAIYRTSHPTGFEAKKIDASETEVGETQTLYADFVRSVFVTGDKVWVTRRNGKWQIRDEGTTSWTGDVVSSIVNGGPGTVRLRHDPQEVRVSAYAYDTQDSIAATTICLVIFNDGEQLFRAIPMTCPSITAEVGGGSPYSTGTGTA